MSTEREQLEAELLKLRARVEEIGQRLAELDREARPRLRLVRQG